MKRSTKIARLQAQLDVLLKRHRASVEVAQDIAARVEEIDDVRERMINAGRRMAKGPFPLSNGERSMKVKLDIPDELHPQTAMLVVAFASALAEKLTKAQEKYGYDDGWRTNYTAKECLDHFHEHIEKGDPIDVAAYTAFMFYHGWNTI